MSTVTVNLRLRTIDDFFRIPDLDPFSEWYQAYSEEPAIMYVEACVGDNPRTEHLDLVVGLPHEAIAPDTEVRLREAIDRYCDARLLAVQQASARNNSRGWLMLAFTIAVVIAILFIAHRLDNEGYETLAVIGEGLSIAAWILLWHPLEALIFNRWDFRLDRRVLRTIRYRSQVRIDALDGPPGR